MTGDLSEWLDDLRTRQFDESNGDHIARVVRAIAGASLTTNSDRLVAIFTCNESGSDAAEVAAFKTNCGTFMREVYCLVGCASSYIKRKYQVEMAVAWDLAAARETGALIDGPQWQIVSAGWGMHYATPGANNDHMEFALSSPDSKGFADHGGGGRANNAITVGHGDIRTSNGRPLLHVIDPDRMLGGSARSWTDALLKLGLAAGVAYGAYYAARRWWL